MGAAQYSDFLTAPAVAVAAAAVVVVPLRVSEPLPPISASLPSPSRQKQPTTPQLQPQLVVQIQAQVQTAAQTPTHAQRASITVRLPHVAVVSAPVAPLGLPDQPPRLTLRTASDSPTLDVASPTRGDGSDHGGGSGSGGGSSTAGTRYPSSGANTAISSPAPSSSPSSKHTRFVIRPRDEPAAQAVVTANATQ